jgi:hypothetical protein
MMTWRQATLFLLVLSLLNGTPLARLASPDERDQMFQLAVDASNGGDTAEAVRLFRLIAQSAPSDAMALCNLGVALMRHGNGPASRPEWERVYSESLRVYLRALVINPNLPDAIDGYDLVKRNVHTRMELVGGTTVEADAVIAASSTAMSDEDFVEISGSGLPTSLGSFSSGDDDGDDEEWEDDDWEDDDEEVASGSKQKQKQKEGSSSKGDAMEQFLAEVGLEKYYDALYS